MSIHSQTSSYLLSLSVGVSICFFGILGSAADRMADNVDRLTPPKVLVSITNGENGIQYPQWVQDQFKNPDLVALRFLYPRFMAQRYWPNIALAKDRPMETYALVKRNSCKLSLAQASADERDSFLNWYPHCFVSQIIRGVTVKNSDDSKTFHAFTVANSASDVGRGKKEESLGAVSLRLKRLPVTLQNEISSYREDEESISLDILDALAGMKLETMYPEIPDTALSSDLVLKASWNHNVAPSMDPLLIPTDAERKLQMYSSMSDN